MAVDKYVYLYPYSLKEARRIDGNEWPPWKTTSDVELWRDSFRENIRCKEAIEQAIRTGFDGMHLNPDCAENVIEAFGYKRTEFVLANTVQWKDWDGRFSPSNQEWAKSIHVPPDRDHNGSFCVDSHPAVTDGFISQYRKAYQALGLFDRTHCESGHLDYEGKVLALSPATLKESYWQPESQLWYAFGGFGCSPTASGRKVLCTCLGDGETTSWDRSDFLGVVKEEHLPDWAMEKRQELLDAKQSQKAAPLSMEMR